MAKAPGQAAPAFGWFFCLTVATITTADRTHVESGCGHDSIAIDAPTNSTAGLVAAVHRA